MTSGKGLNTIKKEMEEFWGVSIIMGNLKFRWITMYCRTSTRVPLIADTITMNHYFKFRSNLHVVSQRIP